MILFFTLFSDLFLPYFLTLLAKKRLKNPDTANQDPEQAPPNLGTSINPSSSSTGNRSGSGAQKCRCIVTLIVQRELILNTKGIEEGIHGIFPNPIAIDKHFF